MALAELPHRILRSDTGCEKVHEVATESPGESRRHDRFGRNAAGQSSRVRRLLPTSLLLEEGGLTPIQKHEAMSTPTREVGNEQVRNESVVTVAKVKLVFSC